MNQKLLILTVLGISLVAVGCKREAPQTPDAAATTATEAATATEPGATDAITVTQNTAADSITAKSKDFDARAFAGMFSGTLPCAGCPGIDTTVELNPDGHFKLTETRQGQGDGPQLTDGTWTVESSGTLLRLDPNSKTDADRVYTIASNDRIAQLDNDKKSASGGLDRSLRRSGSAR